jgi:hypothetical protein
MVARTIAIGNGKQICLSPEDGLRFTCRETGQSYACHLNGRIAVKLKS